MGDPNRLFSRPMMMASPQSDTGATTHKLSRRQKKLARLANTPPHVIKSDAENKPWDEIDSNDDVSCTQ
eukprot:2929446-Karenia_brevis.AAC.1